jgi:hypothetical protein
MAYQLRESFKYSYSNSFQKQNLYLFEIELISKRKTKKIKKVKSFKKDNLLNSKDKINFNKYKLIKLHIVNIKDFTEINIDVEIKQNKIFKNDNIYLEIDNEYGYLKCFYNFIYG